MSVIAAKITDTNITIAADSILMKGTLKRTENFSKLHNVNNIIAGGCGNAEELSIFFEFIAEHKPEGHTIKCIRRFMNAFQSYKDQYIQESEGIENSYLMIYEGHLFEVDGMFVEEVTDYAAIGEGETYALAALHLGHSCEEAISTACKFCCFTAEPIVKYSTERCKEI